MKRRVFIKKGIGTGLAAGAAFSFTPVNGLFAKTFTSLADNYDMVAIRGGEPDVMFDRGIEEMGGMRKFVKKGQTVVVKPNIGWDAPPERGANTHPLLVKRIIEHCYNAGAKQVYVFDNTCNEWTKCYTNSGIEKAAKDAGATVVTGSSERYYQEVTIPKGKNLKNAKVHELILESDVFINVPVLKHHGGANITITMKNLMGAVWDRRFWHANDLHQCIADFANFRKPDLNIVDAYWVMKRNGPKGLSVDDLVLMKSQIISTDMVAADVASCKLYGIEPESVNHIRLAGLSGVGNFDLESVKISRITV